MSFAVRSLDPTFSLDFKSKADFRDCAGCFVSYPVDNLKNIFFSNLKALNSVHSILDRLFSCQKI